MPAQPAAAATSATTVSAILAGILSRHGPRQDELLPALHALQDSVGYIPPDQVPALAQHFNLSRAEVHGVITFYHYFRSAPPARCVVQICRAEACQSMGGDRLLAHAESVLGCSLHGHSADGAFALEPVYCLGLCASSPALTINEAVFARVTPARFDALIADVNQLQEAV
ncbi:formate dehydrogenase subunit gamma [Pseudoduganella lurida]|uniref:Formate dehydrogenase subunit gamma n=1 Tax=Pseudoduganella lurida TaxID=1036180 RepID=A0A562QYI7_9BURK|nr:formate dehydrogenase subunit gamma [Pseudoduganella lurida]TWI61196.1 formate dehydrogenase subunit gamma [Pseudoduganella lurida]